MSDIVFDALVEVAETETAHPAPVPATAPAPAAIAGPMGSALQFLNAGGKLEELKGLLSLQKEWEANEARKAYVADMAQFKLNPPEIFKTKAVKITSKDGKAGPEYKHATLGDVTEKIIEGLAKHGFSHSWQTKQPEGGQIFVTCTLTHRLGHSESTTLNSSRDETGNKNNIQALASTVSYLERYTLLAASGLATKDMPDDDGVGAGLGEGDGAGAPKYNPIETLCHWAGRATAAKTAEDLMEVRRQANVEFLAGNDVEGWEQYKKVHAIAREKLMKAAQK